MIKDLTGQKFHSMTVLSFAGMHTNGKSLWRCRCDCGAVKIVLGNNLKAGNTRSCGHLFREFVKVWVRNTTHGMTAIPEFQIWSSMKNRCTNANHPAYCDYGGRGIRVCVRWMKSFEAFYADMGPRPPGTSLDRKNNNGNYTPKNCRWATPQEQRTNRRRNGTGRRTRHKPFT